MSSGIRVLALWDEPLICVPPVKGIFDLEITEWSGVPWSLVFKNSRNTNSNFEKT
jgi:hypothetical protein